MTEFVALRTKTYAFTHLDNEDQLKKHKKAKGTKKCVIKKHLNFDLYKKALFNNETIRCSQQRFKSDYHNIYTETVHKSAIQSFDEIHTYPYGIDNHYPFNCIIKAQYYQESQQIRIYLFSIKLWWDLVH